MCFPGEAMFAFNVRFSREKYPTLQRVVTRSVAYCCQIFVSFSFNMKLFKIVLLYMT